MAKLQAKSENQRYTSLIIKNSTRPMNDDLNSSDYELNPDDYKSFINLLREKDIEEIEKVLTRYSLYKPEMVEAALYVAVDKGLISYDLKEKLATYTRANFSGMAEAAKQLMWERTNPFRDYVDMFSDEKIYDILENPTDMVNDVFFAVLQVASERKLIEESESERLRSEKITPEKGYFQRRREIRDEVVNDLFFKEEPITDKQAEAYAEKYWKCPKCGELVDMEMAQCWKCEGEIPENVEHPAKEEAIREIKNAKAPISSGRTSLSLIIAGIMLILIGVFRGVFYGYSITDYTHYRYSALIGGALAVVAGVVIGVIKGFPNWKK
jgi:hypothetical protein